MGTQINMEQQHL